MAATGTPLDDTIASTVAVSTHFHDISTSFDDNNISSTASDDISTNIRLSGEILEAIYLLVGTLSMVFNTVSLVVFLSSRKLRQHLHITFLISQSVVDFLAGCFLLSNTLTMRSVPATFGESGWEAFLCKYWYSGFPLWVTLLTSTYNLVALSLVKCCMVRRPLDLQAHFTPVKVYLTIAATYLPGILFYVALFETATGIRDGQCYQISLWPSDSLRLFFAIFTYFLAYLIPIIIHVCCYVCIFKVLYGNKHTNTSSVVKGHHETPLVTTDHHGDPSVAKSHYDAPPVAKGRRAVVRLLLLIVLACLICLSWNLNLLLLFYLNLHKLDFQGWSYHISVILLYTNCLVNPIIYLLFYKDYRKQLVHLCRRCCRKKESVPEMTEFSHL